MKIALIHNPNAFRGEAEGSELRRVFEHAGHHVEYVSIREQNWQRVISPEIERAIIVGGDGTVQLVAPHLKGIPFSILPFGTANNIAQCLHQTANPKLLASQLDHAQISHLDLGKATAGRKSKTFLEAVGMGVFVELILAMQDWPKKFEMEQAQSRKQKFEQALEQLQAISREYQGMAWELKVNDTVITDRFLLIAAMNMELIGPRLHLAPNADPGDGLLEVVFVRQSGRANLCRWLERQSPGQKQAANFESRRCHRVAACAGEVAPVHIDSDLVQKPEFPVIVELEPAALNYTVLRG
jgi:diacylglycerol kinase (ATP)